MDCHDKVQKKIAKKNSHEIYLNIYCLYLYLQRDDFKTSYKTRLQFLSLRVYLELKL